MTHCFKYRRPQLNFPNLELKTKQSHQQLVGMHLKLTNQHTKTYLRSGTSDFRYLKHKFDGAI